MKGRNVLIRGMEDMEKKLLAMDVSRIIPWITPLFALTTSIMPLAGILDWKWEIIKQSFAQGWVDIANLVPCNFDLLTWLLALLAFQGTIVIAIAMDGKDRIKGTIRHLSTASVGTSILISALIGIFFPYLMGRYGFVVGLTSVLFIYVWSYVLAVASRIIGEKGRREIAEEELKSEKNDLEKRLSVGHGEKSDDEKGWRRILDRYGFVLWILIPSLISNFELFWILFASRCVVLLFLCALLFSLLDIVVLVPILFDYVVHNELHFGIRVAEYVLWTLVLLQFIFLPLILSLSSMWRKLPTWSQNLLGLIALVCFIFLFFLPGLCRWEKCRCLGNGFDYYRRDYFRKRIDQIDKTLESTPTTQASNSEQEDHRNERDRKADISALDVNQSLNERLAALECQTAALLEATERMESSISRTRREDPVRRLFRWLGSIGRSSNI